MSPNENIREIILSEAKLVEILGAQRRTVRSLTLEEGLPGIRLERGLYVYKAQEVLNWIESRKACCRSAVTDSKDGPSIP